MPLTFTENRQRNVGLAVSTNPRTVLRSTGLAEATQAEALAGLIQHRYISPLRLQQKLDDSGVSGAALTRVDDTNVTLALGGTPTTALLRATSITVGWSGTLAAARGGFGADVSASSGVPLFSAGVATFTSTTGTGNFVRATSPTLVTPVLGTPTSVTLTNGAGLPIATGVSGLGTGIATALAVNTGSAGAPVLFNGALGTPSSGTLTNATGLPIGAGTTGTLGADRGGTGVANNAASTITISGNFGTTFTVSGATSVTFPTSGTLATLAGTEELDNKTLDASVGKGTWTASGTWTLPAFTAGGLITLSSGQIAFPATAVPSADANTLDDYEEGTFTPVLTFATPGDLSVAYSTQLGHYVKIGKVVFCQISIDTSTFTHTTASGNCQITGQPFAGSFGGSAQRGGGCQWVGVTKANYTDMVGSIGSDGSITPRMSGSGQAAAILQAADMPTGGDAQLHMSAAYFT